MLELKSLKKRKLLIIAAIVADFLLLILLLVLCYLLWNNYNTLFYLTIIVFVCSFIFMAIGMFLIFVLYKQYSVMSSIFKDKSTSLSNVSFSLETPNQVTKEKVPCYEYTVNLSDKSVMKVYSFYELEEISKENTYSLKVSERYNFIIRMDKE